MAHSRVAAEISLSECEGARKLRQRGLDETRRRWRHNIAERIDGPRIGRPLMDQELEAALFDHPGQGLGKA